MPLSPSSLIWYQSQGSDVCDLEGNRRSGVALAICVTDLSDLFTYGLKAQVKQMSTPPTLFMGYGTLYLLPLTGNDFYEDPVY